MNAAARRALRGEYFCKEEAGGGTLSDAGTIDVLIEDPRWEALGLEALAEAAARAALRHLGLAPGAYEISLLGCDDARIAGLNRGFRGKAAATNVLSWPSEERGAEVAGAAPALPAARGEEIVELGDIAIAYDTCAREAAEAGRGLAGHVSHLLVHGVLHLLGYDHIRDEDAALMEGLEITILATLGIPDPYREQG